MKFPHILAENDVNVTGMTLRDYFAGQALMIVPGLRDYSLSDDKPRAYARAAYRMADAMLAARQEPSA